MNKRLRGRMTKLFFVDMVGRRAAKKIDVLPELRTRLPKNHSCQECQCLTSLQCSAIDYIRELKHQRLRRLRKGH